MEALKVGLSDSQNLEKYSCMGLTYSSISDKEISERLAEKNAAFFAEDYLLFLMSPEEAGSSFQKAGAQCNLTGAIDLDLIKKVNSTMAELPEEVKQSIITKVDNLMVSLLKTSWPPKIVSPPPTKVSWLQKNKERSRI
jgi:hypothetical protein